MRQYYSLFIAIILCFFALRSEAQQLKVFPGLYQSWGFEKNLGQMDNDPTDPLLYAGDAGNVKVFCFSNRLRFSFIKSNEKPIEPKKFALPDTNSALECASIDMKLTGANPAAHIREEEQMVFKTNYYNPKYHNGLLNISHFRKLIYENIYSQIDMVLEANGNGIKYEFVIHPGGAVSNIKLEWQGADHIELKNGGLKYSNILGYMAEAAPISYNGEKNIATSFQLVNNRVSFTTENFNKTKDLIIDPNLEWGTYYGGSSFDIINGIACDSSYIAVTGSTRSSSGIAYGKSFQNIFASGIAMFIAEFTSGGQIIWGTYFYGAAYTTRGFAGLSVAYGKDKNIYIGGVGNGSNLATKNAHQMAFEGKSDGILAKFDKNGRRIWTTYYGGGKYDNCGWVAISPKNDVYISGYTTSDSFIASTGAFQTTRKAFATSYIARFDTGGNFKWGTYFGGTNSNDITNPEGLSCDTAGNVYCTGFTTATSGIVSPGAFQSSKPSAAGDTAAYIASFDQSGKRRWGTYFGKTAVAPYSIVSDQGNSLYIAGRTTANSQIGTAGTCDTAFNGAAGDGFIAKMDVNGHRIWATLVGSNKDDRLTRLAYSPSGYLDVLGTTNSPSGLATHHTLQSKTNGGYTYFMAIFDTSGSNRYWASYFAQNTTTVNDIALQNTDTLYLAGSTTDTSFGTYKTHQPKYQGLGDGFIAKFSGMTPPFNFTTLLGDTAACQYNTSTFYATSKPKSKYSWSVTGGSIISGSTSDTIQVKWSTAGKQFIKIIQTDSNGNVMTDSMYANIHPAYAVSLSGAALACPGDSIRYKIPSLAGYNYSWSIKGGILIGGTNLDSATVAWPNATTGKLKIITTSAFGCKDSDSLQVLVTKPQPVFTISHVCPGDTTRFTDSSLYNTSSTWQFGDGGTSSRGNTRHIYTMPGTYHIVLSLSRGSCKNTATSTLIVPALPVTHWSIVRINNTTIGFHPQDSSAMLYSWSFGDGDSDTTVHPVHRYGATGAYTVGLHITDKNGCKNSLDSSLSIYTGIEEALATVHSFEIYPNPFANKLHIEWIQKTEGNTEVSLWDMAGREIVCLKSGMGASGKNMLDYTATGLPKGVYFIKLTNSEGSAVRKIVKMDK